MSEKKPTRQAEIVFAAMKAIEANGGEMRISDIYETLASSFPLTDYEKEETKSGVIRWKAYLNFYSIEVGKVGYLVKKSGIWHLTEEGAKALAAGAGEFFADFHGKFSKKTLIYPIPIPLRRNLLQRRRPTAGDERNSQTDLADPQWNLYRIPRG